MRARLNSFVELMLGLVWVLLLHPIWSRQRRDEQVWVIGGHRGRAHLDNAAALEAEARSQGRSIVWVANPSLIPTLKTKGIRTARRHSMAARKLISQAHVLAYSHGEDDLDVHLILLRGRTAPRVYLNHSLNLLKAGGVLAPEFDKLGWFIAALKRWFITDWDVLLCVSDTERDYFRASYPMHADKMILGGGAHLDSWTPSGSPPKRRIYWFPTFRDYAGGNAAVERCVQEVCTSEVLREWLLQHDYELRVGLHINARFEGEGLELQHPFSVGTLEHLAEDMRDSEMLISDFSGLVFTFLMLKRPQILFAFDLETYLQHRRVYPDYASLDFALHPSTPSELVTMITSEAWREPELLQASNRWRAQCLPPHSEGFAAASLAAIDRFVETR